ncbi:response regulator transcription factor [Brevibacillus composti]|uniref:Response regulator transcription factor n=1 Tax=Brevibacillus composti TaxID=2796470 RepID=A0A7T5EMS4_9BACL|nr:response regulator transcription factor [Brevibacillus composti]QQE75387.1 response regulator transcription factor [Brevibacillus composti]QUO42413.1 response regulator transcription factor [Brevibacillus composti]
MNKKILIVEDDISIAELQRDYLEVNGFSVHVEQSGESGLAQALEGDYDLIILDVMLPHVDGFELCKQIRARKNIPILMVTAKKEEIDTIRGFGLGADDYVIKPFSPGELVARVKAHLARYERLLGGKEEQTDEIEIRGLRIDRASRRVYVHGAEVSFTTKEFDLLTFFFTHPNRVFSKEQLFERIWGMDSAGDISTVTVHIRKLREKVEADPSHPQYIETVWGAGYRFTV